ncbi:beta-L-arabinofuranosidase domain-containing protein [Actinoplanes sp. DH11]|uniref:glycoside hydrolase family 127 protein n=1 Tax=Actinoplanes sp. DH11 TaxID=2857011 RepID=UPI001E5AF18E|nr:beta-L-arabinofuranosidase domain-containing protein [Actinoplanes sp. DH11]
MTINEIIDQRLGAPVAPSLGRLQPLGLREVTLREGFWQRRQDVNRTNSLAHIESWLERAGWLGNFTGAPQHRRGREFSDSEIYKLLEAMAWELGRSPDAGLEERYRSIVARVAAAQDADGYLNTNFGRPGQQPRYSDLEWGHELYCYGHLIQAAVARARTFGADQLVDVAIRAADHLCDAFGPGGIASVCGHAEIEPALVELYRVTGNTRYLDQARLFVERRGHQVLSDIEFGRSYFQDDMPVREATVLRGHAVRAVYLAAGAVDLAVETGDTDLLDAVTRQWQNTVARRVYITGGIGSRHQDEAFGEDFVLPPDRAYSETCAGVGSVMLAWRLLLAQGDARYADLMERTLFNVIATSPSDDGTRFFYANTLHQRETGTEPAPDALVPRAASTLRAPWFSVSCCPTNLARTFASLAGYIATKDDDGVQIHQYAAASIRTGDIGLDVETDYPVSGQVAIRVVHSPAAPWTLTLRIPHWATGATVDGAQVSPGLVHLRRDFTAGDTVLLDLAVTPRLTTADPRIDAVRGCAVVERGPVVYCAESVDLPDGVPVDALRLDPGVPLHDHDGGVAASCQVTLLDDDSWPYHDPAPELRTGAVDVTLRPYHDWASRGPSTMRVWLPLADQP